ncbi:MAG: ubiquinol-cytochrome c reductase iron-sulfur subunit [Actinomycetota bacterium]
MNSQSPEKRVLTGEMTRRGAICALATLTLGAMAAPAVAASGVKVLSNGRVEVTLAKNPALKSVGGVVRIDGVSGRSIALVRTANGRNGFTALDLRCTHEGTLVEQEGDIWGCRNHGAAFSLSGEVKIGPARSPLRKLRVTATAKKVVIS